MTAPTADEPFGPVESVVLVDDDGRSIGSAPKSTVHHGTTPLHLAFSCYVFDADGALFLTQRSFAKTTWPGVWTNTVCGHPSPGESVGEAVRRRTGQEVGLQLRDLRLVLPKFRYRAVMDNGVVENELCPVFVAITDDAPRPDPDEVHATDRVAWADFTADVLHAGRPVSPWCLEQVVALSALGPDPADWPTRDQHELPEAAR